MVLTTWPLSVGQPHQSPLQLQNRIRGKERKVLEKDGDEGQQEDQPATEHVEGY